MKAGHHGLGVAWFEAVQAAEQDRTRDKQPGVFPRPAPAGWKKLVIVFPSEIFGDGF
jgi:hypothetical protein